MTHQVWNGCKPFYFPGGKTGLLLVHGYIGTPDEVKRMGEDFAQRGYTVLGVRLFAHATHARDMHRVRWQDWLADIEDGLAILSATCDTIVIAGLSMGGVLSLLAGATYPQIKAIIAMSTPIDLIPTVYFGHSIFSAGSFQPFTPCGWYHYWEKAATRNTTNRTAIHRLSRYRSPLIHRALQTSQEDQSRCAHDSATHPGCLIEKKITSFLSKMVTNSMTCYNVNENNRSG